MLSGIRLFIILSLIGCAVVIYLVFSLRKSECTGLTCVSFNNKTDFTSPLVYENNQKTYRALYKDKDQILRVESYSQIMPEQAKKFNEYKTMQLTSLFENAQSPYPGAISDEISCDKKYKPVFKQLNIDSLNISYYSGYLNDRLQYGSCIGDQLKFKSSAAMFYCQTQKKWYQLEFISPINQEDNDNLYLIKSISCVNQPPKTGNFFP